MKVIIIKLKQSLNFQSISNDLHDLKFALIQFSF